MKKGLIRKGLVLSVIVLFITVGVQPVFAGESITTTLDKEEDCIECEVSDGISLLRAKILLFKTKVVTNFVLSSRLGDIPEIKESSQETLDVINHNKPLDDRLICRILQSLDESLMLLMDSLEELIAIISNEQILFQLDFLNFTLFTMRVIIYNHGASIDCWGPPPI